MEKTSKKHLSASQVTTYIRCPRIWKYQKVDGIRSPQNGAMFMSSVWHETVERNYKQKIKTDIDLALDTMKDFYSATFDAKSSFEEIVLKKNETLSKLKNQGLKVVSIHRKAIAPKVRPKFVEEKFVVSLGNNFPFDLLGYWDLIEQDGTIADNKAYHPGFIPSQKDLKKDIQFSIYSLAYRLRFNQIERSIRMDCIAKSNPPRAVQIQTERTNEDLQDVLNLIEKVAYGIQNEFFPPVTEYWKATTRNRDGFLMIKNKTKNNQQELYQLNHPDHNWCSQRFCFYWDQCQKEEQGNYFIN